MGKSGLTLEKAVARAERGAKFLDRRFGGMEYTISTDELWDRGNPDYRFRVYSLDQDGDLHVLCACPDAEAIGVALVTLHEEGLAPVGILDVGPVSVDGEAAETGTWVVSPFRATSVTRA